MDNLERREDASTCSKGSGRTVDEAGAAAPANAVSKPNGVANPCTNHGRHGDSRTSDPPAAAMMDAGEPRKLLCFQLPNGTPTPIT